MVERSRSRVTAEPALLDSGKLDVQIPEYAMIVEKYGSRFDSIGHRFGPAAGVKTTNGWERGTTAPISFEQNSPPRAIEKSFFCGAVLPRGQGKGRRPPITASSKTLK